MALERERVLLSVLAEGDLLRPESLALAVRSWTTLRSLSMEKVRSVGLHGGLIAVGVELGDGREARGGLTVRITG